MCYLELLFVCVLIVCMYLTTGIIVVEWISHSRFWDATLPSSKMMMERVWLQFPGSVDTMKHHHVMVTSIILDYVD